jgi:3',5'-cyclic AMP phosphodiesterase CpdA
MSVLLQISDPHFGSEKPAAVEALVRLVERLEPELVMLSGDITQRARQKQFEAAAAFMRRLKVPNRLVIPGNHDIPLFDPVTRFLSPYGRYQKAFGSELEPSYDARGCLVLGVNSTRRQRATDGEISEEQRERVARALRAAAPTQLRVVVLHHPVAVPREAEVHNLAHGSADAVRAWSEAGADVILAGHIHLPFVLPLHELAQDLKNPIWAVNAGTAVSTRTRRDASNSVNVLRTSLAEPRVCTVEQWTFGRAGSDFERNAEVRLTSAPSAILDP